MPFARPHRPHQVGVQLRLPDIELREDPLEQLKVVSTLLLDQEDRGQNAAGERHEMNRHVVRLAEGDDHQAARTDGREGQRYRNR